MLILVVAFRFGRGDRSDGGCGFGFDAEKGVDLLDWDTPDAVTKLDRRKTTIFEQLVDERPCTTDELGGFGD